MKRSSRLLVEILGPALIGTVLLLAWKHAEFARTTGITFRVFGAYLAFAYLFAIIPSLAYAGLMEAWLKARSSKRFGMPGVVGFSTALGLVAGYVIYLASEAPVVGLGALVGLILGSVLGYSTEGKKA